MADLTSISNTTIRPLLLIFFVISLSACASSRPPVPPGIVPPPRDVTPAEEQYGQKVLAGLTEKFEIDYNDPRLDDIWKVIDRLTVAAKADKYPWHVYLFKAPKVKNAAATRGNHVFVWSGMLDLTKNDDELATILAHELGHVLAGHTDPDPNEQLKKILLQVGAVAAGVAVSAATRNAQLSGDLGRITAQLTGEVGSGFLLNPYSKEKELEADHIGLFLMANAKYNPQAAVEFWTRVQSDPSFGSQMEFFSTHPPAEDRLSRLKALLPRAMDRYAGIKKSTRLPLNSIRGNPSGTPRRTNKQNSFSWD